MQSVFVTAAAEFRSTLKGHSLQRFGLQDARFKQIEGREGARLHARATVRPNAALQVGVPSTQPITWQIRT